VANDFGRMLLRDDVTAIRDDATVIARNTFDNLANLVTP
jgi:hypothetical protein